MQPENGLTFTLNTTLLNISIGLPTYFSTLSSRFLSRLKRIDEFLSQDGLDQPPLPSPYVQTSARARGDRPSMPFQPLPAPWTFATSGYAIGLMVVALLLNRIQNMVVPPRHFIHPSRSDRGRPTSPLLAPFRKIWSFFFPVDLSSTFCRLVFRVPSVYLLARVLAIWFIVCLQSFDLYPSIHWLWLQSIGSWAAEKETQDICWSTFGAICIALCIGALTRGLEGVSNENTAPFNLFGYAFLLHIYSSPITHIAETTNLPTRPNKHVIVTIILPLLQLSMIHFLGVRKDWSRQRLVPTTICSLLSLIHFHSVFWKSPASYPLLNYFPAFLESFLAFTTSLACGLNILTQILLEGAVRRPIFGHAESLAPKWDEDFSIVLLRLGTASLEATNLAGLGNEVGGVSLASNWLDPKLDTYDARHRSSTIELGPGGVSSPLSRGISDKKKGFDNEIRNIRAVSTARSGGIWVHSAWYAEFFRFWLGVWKVVTGFWRFVKSGDIRIRNPLTQRSPEQSGRSHEEPSSNARSPADDPSEHDPYEAFLRGASLSDDEEDYNGSPTSSSSRISGSDDTEDHYGEEAAGLYIDLSTTDQDSAPPAMLLAHMTDASASPLTRRRYRRLVPNPDATESPPGNEHQSSSGDRDFWTEYAHDRRRTTVQPSNYEEQIWEDTRRNCVICTSQPRQIICWPCRCLALCDDCRENLASRSSASKHTCPCCRRSVEGFSRIYIP